MLGTAQIRKRDRGAAFRQDLPGRIAAATPRARTFDVARGNGLGGRWFGKRTGDRWRRNRFPLIGLFLLGAFSGVSSCHRGGKLLQPETAYRNAESRFEQG